MLLGHSGQSVRHTDEYQVPCTIRVDYHFGLRRHLITTSVCTPESEGSTRIYTQLAIRWGLLSSAMLVPLKKMTRRILDQDCRVLESQQKTMQTFGKRFASTDADTPTVWVERALKLFEAGSFPPAELRRTQVEYRL